MDGQPEREPGLNLLTEVDFEQLEFVVDLDTRRAQFLQDAARAFEEPTIDSLSEYNQSKDEWYILFGDYLLFLIRNEFEINTSRSLADLILQAYLYEDEIINNIFADITDDEESFFPAAHESEFIAEATRDLSSDDLEAVTIHIGELLGSLSSDVRKFENYMRENAQSTDESMDGSDSNFKDNKDHHSKYVLLGKAITTI